MAQKPEISLIVSSFERPAYLRRCLQSIAAQKGVQGGDVEVVVADDGSRDETEDVVAEAAAAFALGVRFATHEHDGFRLSQCRNEGALAATADYLLFTDGDCVLPSDHVAQHLRRRQPGRVIAGNCYRLDAEASKRFVPERTRPDELRALVRPPEARRILLAAVRARLYEFLRVPMRPRLSGNNMGVWRADLERVNGFDENFVGWGMEDKDFQRRLARAGVRTCTILHRTKVFHLWHETHATYAYDGKGTKNHAYYHRGEVETRCATGLAERRAAGFSCTTFGGASAPTSR